MSRKASLAFQGLDADQLSEFIPDLQEKSDLTCVVCFLCLFLLFVFAVCCVCFFYFLRLPPFTSSKKHKKISIYPQSHSPPVTHPTTSHIRNGKLQPCVLYLPASTLSNTMGMILTVFFSSPSVFSCFLTFSYVPLFVVATVCCYTTTTIHNNNNNKTIAKSQNHKITRTLTRSHSELDLSGNRLASLPPSMSQLSNLRVLNITQNPFYDFEMLLSVLQSMSSLETLTIDIEGPAQEDKEDLLILGLPKLKFFNGLSLMEGDDEETSSALALSNRPPPAPVAPVTDSIGVPSALTATLTSTPGNATSNQALEEADLESAALLFGAVKDLMGSLAPKDDARLSDAFDVHVKTVIKTLKFKLDGVTDPFIQRGEILMAKHELYEVCFAEVINVASSSSPKFGAVLRKLRDIHKDLFAEFPATLHEMRPHYLQRLSDMKAQVVRAERESSLLLEAAEVLEKEAIQHSQEKEEAFLSNSIAISSSAAVVSSSSSFANNKQLQQQSGGGRSMVRSNAKSNGGYASPATASASKRPVTSSFSAAMSGPLPAEATPGGGAFGPSSGPPRAKSSATKPQRVLSLKQLKEQFVSLIYDSKMKFDRKCKDAHLPRETMEMHM